MKNNSFYIGIIACVMLLAVLISCEEPTGGSSSGGDTPTPPGGGGGDLQPTTRAQLLQLISDRVGKDKSADLNDIDTSKVTDMSNLFMQYPTFNGNISKWNVSSVTNMSGMFEGVTGFRGGISNWDVSKVTNMSNMFKGATAFNSDISGWDVSKVTQINSMFEGASAFTQDLKVWAVAPAVSKVSNDVFKNSGVTENPRWLTLEVLLEPKIVVAIVGQAVNISITRWPVTTTGTFTLTPVVAGDALPTGMSFNKSTGTITAKAGDIKTITAGSPKKFTITFTGTGHFDKEENKNIKTKLSVSVKDYSTTPKSKEELIALLKVILDIDGNGLLDNVTADLNGIDVSAITDMSYVFNDGILKEFNGNISMWDVSNVKNMREMFSESKYTGENGGIARWEVGNVTNMRAMFYSSQFNRDISSWDVSKVTDMGYMFEKSQFNGDISSWDVSNVVNMYSMFRDAKVFNKDISIWAVDSVTTMQNMFARATAFDQDLEAWGEHITGRTVNTSNIFINANVSDNNIPTWLYKFKLHGNTITFLGQSIVVSVQKQIPSTATGAYSIEPNTFETDTGLSFSTKDGTIRGVTTKEVAKKTYTITFTGDAKFQGKSITVPLSLEVKANQGKYAYFPTNKKELIAAIKDEMDLNDDGGLDDNKADLNVIFTGNVTDMSGVFSEFALRNFNGDISKWDVSNVKDMTNMFYASKFNGDISSWNVSKVTVMDNMFRGSQFTGDISKWDVGNVTGMVGMFFNTKLFNSDISNWDVSNVKDMDVMFYESEFTGDISKWDVSNVVNMSSMFEESQFNGDISGWDVKNVTDMSAMFAVSQFTGDISKWDVGNVIDMSFMFRKSQFNGDISSWKVSKVTNMGDMFKESKFTGDISGWDVSNVRYMNNMFRNSQFTGNISGWDVSKVMSMPYMFYESQFNGNISEWAVDNVTIIQSMFQRATAFDQDLEAWGEHLSGRTINTTNIFRGSQLSDVHIPTWLYTLRYRDNNITVNKREFTTHDTGIALSIERTPTVATGTYSIAPDTFVTDTGLAFDANTGTISGSSTKALLTKEYTITFVGNGDYARKRKSTTLSITIRDVSSKTYFPKTKAQLIANIKTVMDTNNDGSPNNNSADLNVIYTGYITDMSGVFYDSDLRDFNGDISSWDVKKVTNMNSMFEESKFTGENGDITNWNVGNVKNMNDMFRKSSYAGDISGWDLRNVTTMNEMFRETSYNKDITGWDVLNVTSMRLMFYKNTVFDQDISAWNVSKVVTMDWMFGEAEAFNQDISDWDVESVINVNSMFRGATAFDKNLDAWGEHMIGRTVSTRGIFNTSDDSGLIFSESKIPTWLYNFVLTVDGNESNTIDGVVGTAIEDNGTITVKKKYPATATGNYTISPNIQTDIGLTLDTNTGTISGNPNKMQSKKTYTLTFHGTGDYAGKSYKIPFSMTIAAGKYSYHPTDKAELITVIKTVMAADGDGDGNPDGNTADLNSIYTGDITDMSVVFKDAALRNFNGDISGWDVSKVTNMRDMFNASKFNGDITSWDVRKVSNMAGMFGNATAFNQDISSWNVSNLTNMSYMFYGATAFNQDISSWAVDSVTNMRNMFTGAAAFDQDLELWGEHMAGRTVNTANIFKNIAGDGLILPDVKIPTWRYILSQTYQGSSSHLFLLLKGRQVSITLNNTGVSTFNATGTYSIEPSTFTADTGLVFDTSSGSISGTSTIALSRKNYTITFTGSGAYAGKRATILFAMQVDDKSGTYTYRYFPVTRAELIANIKTVMAADGDGDGNPDGDTADLNSIYTGDMTDMSRIFNTRALNNFNGDISSWDVGNVKNMESMFFDADSFNGDISLWDVGNVTNMNSMFAGADLFNRDISSWDVGNVIDMENMFAGADSFNGDISSWDVSKVTSMQSMFGYTITFNQDISRWAVDRVTNMRSMFRGAAAFNQNLDAWGEHIAGRTVNITDVLSNQSNTGYILSKEKMPGWIYTVTQTYLGAVVSSFKIGVGQRNTNITLNNTGVSTFDATGTYSIEPSTFTADTGLQLNAQNGTISGSPNKALSRKTYAIKFTGNGTYRGKVASKEFTIEIAQLANTYSYYPNSRSQLLIAIKDVMDTNNDGSPNNNNADLNVIYTGDITDMSGVFYDSALRNFDGDISSWDVSKVTNMSNMFKESKFNGNISSWDVSKVTNMNAMFYKADAFNNNISGWAVDRVTNMQSMFREATAFDKNLDAWGEHMAGRGVTTTNIFSNQNNNGYILSDEKIPGWIYTLSQTYKGAVSSLFALVVGQKNVSITLSNTGASIFNATGTYSIEPSTFTADTGLAFDATNGTISGTSIKLLLPKKYTITFTGNGVYVGKKATKEFTIQVNKYKYYPTNKVGLIANIKTVMDTNGDNSPDNNNADLNVIYTGNITDMSRVFNDSELRSFNGDISGWDTSKVTNMSRMFENSQFNGDVSQWNVSKVTDMSYMFARANAFNGDISLWDVSKVTNMEAMFFTAVVFNQDISDWKVGNVTNMKRMFGQSGVGPAGAFNGDISGWDVSKVTDMESMFEKSVFTGKNGGILYWQVGNVTDMEKMFSTSKFNGDISGWDISKVTNMKGMFWRNIVFNGDITKWDVRKVTDIREMFKLAIAFNQDISGWAIEGTNDITSILEGANDFNQDIYEWNVHLGSSPTTSNAFKGTALEKNSKLPDWAGGTYTGPPASR